ncbi:MAG: hypothetical protein E7597_04915 [Ruminococcaceae bacterium]|nr:hypothetical protein [Oscillospiraceae bacterium]
MKRKGLIIMLAAFISLSATLSGCGNKEEESSSADKTSSAVEESIFESMEESSAEDSTEETTESLDGESSEETSESSDMESSGETTESSDTETSEISDIESSEESESTVAESSEESAVTESSEELPAETEYAVTVKAPDGTPCTSGIVVKFMQNGEQVAMQVPNSNGIAAKTLPTGEYTVELAFTGEEFYYEQSDLTLSGTDSALTVELCNSLNGEAFTLYVAGNEFNAYDIPVGQTAISLTAGMNYFVFTPTVAGTYDFKPSVDNAIIGYYGGPHFVQSSNIGEVINNTLTLSVSASGISTTGAGTTQFVLGIEADEDIDLCVLSIVRTGDAQLTIADMPWDIYETSVSLAPYTVPAGASLVNFDLKADTAYNLVFNDDDGFYHLNTADGPLVMVWLTVDPAYMACFNTILDRSGVSRYFFDENGNCTKKENYSNCLLEYIECADEEKGVYPLTKDLEYIIKQRGEYVGWWDSTSNGYIFVDRNGNPDLNINTENAWLFMCCYLG